MLCFLLRQARFLQWDTEVASELIAKIKKKASVQYSCSVGD